MESCKTHCNTLVACGDGWKMKSLGDKGAISTRRETQHEDVIGLGSTQKGG